MKPATKKKAKKVTKKKVVETPKRNFDGKYYELKGNLINPDDAIKLVEKIRKEQSEDAFFCMTGVKEISNEYIEEFLELMFPLRGFKMKFFNVVPTGVRKLIMLGWNKKIRSYKDKLRLTNKAPVLGIVGQTVEVVSHSNRPSELKGKKKAHSHKNSGEYTSTDYYVVGETLYIFVRAKEKTTPNIWWSLPKSQFNKDFARHLFENELESSIDKANDFVSNYIDIKEL